MAKDSIVTVLPLTLRGRLTPPVASKPPPITLPAMNMEARLNDEKFVANKPLAPAVERTIELRIRSETKELSCGGVP